MSDYKPGADTNVKRYIDSDVLTEAKKRIRHIIDAFDKVFVSFSGGKDSLTALHLVQEVYDELGIKEKIKVIFRDEELIPDSVIEFVQEYAESGRYDFYYYAVPLRSHKFILGKTYEYVQWDPNRPHLRKPPPYAITLPAGDTRVFDQYTTDAFIAEGHKGKIAFITGIRADESMTRLRASINKRNENYINATAAKNVMLCKPIYDWSQTDIFKYLYERQIRYCGVYDMELVNGQQLRVATPLHAQQAKRLDKVATLDPVFYDQLMQLFPEMEVQSRYWNEYDRAAVYDQYPHSFDGILQYIDAEFDDADEAAKAKKRVHRIIKTRANNEAQGKRLGCYPVLYVFKAVVAGEYKHEIMPKKVDLYTKAELEYEGLS